MHRAGSACRQQGQRPSLQFRAFGCSSAILIPDCCYNSPMQNGSVLISGMGIAGCTLAYWLGEHGFNPTLVERAPRLRTGGYVIDFWGAGYDVAERMGLLTDLKSEGYDIKELRLVNSLGKRVGGFGVDVFRALTGGRYVSLPRGDLARMIYHKIDGRCETIFADSIAAIEQNSEGVKVTFEHSLPRRFQPRRRSRRSALGGPRVDLRQAGSVREIPGLHRGGFRG